MVFFLAKKEETYNQKKKLSKQIKVSKLTPLQRKPVSIKPHDHNHDHGHGHSSHINERKKDDLAQIQLKQKYKKQLKRLQKTYLKFLPKTTNYELTVGEETKVGVVVQVKIFKNNTFDHSFSAVIHPKTGKVISTHASTLHENPKNKKNIYMSPTGRN